MKEAQEIWRTLPRQLASDLRRFFNLNIRDWHQAARRDGELVLSSYELLELFGARIETEPETGDVHPDSIVVVQDGANVYTRRYGDLALKGARSIVVDFPPQDGAVDRAMRDGGFSRMEKIAADTHNELAFFRATYYAKIGGKKAQYEPDLILDPRIERAREEKSREARRLQLEVEKELAGRPYESEVS